MNIVSVRDGSGNEVGQGTGTLLIPEFTNSTGEDEDYEIRANVLTDTTGGKAKAVAMTHAVPEIRRVLGQFVAELKAK